MRNAGRIVIDADGLILESDDVFCATVLGPASMVGTNALDITAAGDRDRCARIIDQVIADGKPVVTEKRLIRSDGSNVWVRNTLSLIGPGEDRRIEILLEKSLPAHGSVAPDKLLRTARLVFDSRRERARAFGADLFTDHAWDLLLSAYIGEAEGTSTTIARLHARAGISLATGSRWIRALAAEGLLEYEDGGNTALVTTPFRLTGTAHHKFEFYLSHLYERSTNGQEIALG